MHSRIAWEINFVMFRFTLARKIYRQFSVVFVGRAWKDKISLFSVPDRHATVEPERAERHLIIFHKRKSKERHTQKLHHKVDKLLLRLNVWYYAATCFNLALQAFRKTFNVKYIWRVAEIFYKRFIAILLKHFPPVVRLLARAFLTSDHVCGNWEYLHFHLGLDNMRNLLSREFWDTRYSTTCSLRSQTRNNSRDERFFNAINIMYKCHGLKWYQNCKSERARSERERLRWLTIN